ncbi:PREDICTED: putative glucose-6-phosphate 1-epimerase [Ipomoea nil]|uniref:putative glucose-6-phosphate 1-epimerase n=1 Tax=Ipomoea nil TaxID=35883 RepID=UPI0009008FB0|nr:PREDICTED: putative glucose-6-phosphate 1-epimerase [Ipomoea nil]XP_019159888.1 PREDICTED: putative glucose-6-phosphate 1-epimerase [Ipomoea nil]XP_019176813.1 PREDICTED: putative glucose-6-phosphate 1-epimerase [Ipomoea nil]XP_019197748.1 PREDICTED: putative glucose-6-phosphate 1-epimerase [Ipomoea nil]
MMAGTSSEKKAMEVCKGMNDLDKVVLREVNGSSAEVYLYGGHVTSWKNVHGEELLFLSSKATFNPPHPIRGGIAICFPQLAEHGPLKKLHGFARNSFWSIDEKPLLEAPENSKAFVDLILKPSENDLNIWPHRFEFRLRLTLKSGGESGHLILISQIGNLNTAGKSFDFTFGYHTYLPVSSDDIGSVRVEGPDTMHCFDKLQKGELNTEQYDAAIKIEGQVDKIYLNTPTKIAIIDHESNRTYVMNKGGLPDAVLWNPWDKKVKKISNLGDNEYQKMLCVGAAAVEKPITLKAGAKWKGWQELHIENSSYNSGELDPQGS